MREIVRRFNSGEIVPAYDFNHGGLDFFADVVHPLVRQEKATKQPDFFGEVWYKRNTPLIEMTPEKEHLLRPVETPCTDNFQRELRPAGW